MLKLKAHAYDVDPSGDYMRPGNTPPEQAFQLLRCGLAMLLTVADTAFPSLDRRTQKRGPKYLRSSLLFYGEVGMLVFAQAAPLLLWKLDGHLSGTEPPELTAEHHRKFFETVISFYPYRKGGINVPEILLKEFKVMEDQELRESVTEGLQSPNEYSQALMRGENPNEDPELVAIQREYATDFFIDRAIMLAITRSLNPNDKKLLGDKMTRFQGIEDPSTAAEFRRRARSGWIEGSKTYLEYAQLEVG
jgi:hypothetical protein